ncbi:ABC transporter substrate-binding protein [Parafrankia sp. FMc2]|uniref:ABC transporter substrate-binding protein n=1 Tax=Parafrankia sp. FMc2 TaxID=3233196 RepID=UPI0034D6AF52
MLRRKVLAVVVLCTMALAACGGGGGSSTGSSEADAGTPVSGGQGQILMVGEPRSLDPAALGNAYAATAVLGNALYGTLITDDDSGDFHYRIAESFTTTDNGATFSLKLRTGLTFSDGTPLNAEAVKFNWDRVKDPATGSPSRAEAASIISSEVIDDLTLKITLSNPTPRFAGSITTSSLNWIASPTALRKGQQAFDAAPVGAGPFTLQSWTRQGSIELTRNARYWDAPKPYLDRLSIRVLTDATQRYNTVQTGGADVAVESDWKNLNKAEGQNFSVDVHSLNGGLYLAMNTRRAPFNDIRARQAIAEAIDLETLNSTVYNGEGKLAETLFEDTSPFYSDKPLRSTDRQAAQRLFDELAAEGKSVSFTFFSFPSSESRLIAENIQAQLSSYQNVKVDMQVIDQSKFGELRATYDFDMLISSAMFQDPEPRLLTVLGGRSPSNLTGFNDPELDRALLAGRTSTSEADRQAAYEDVQERIRETTPVIFIARIASGAIGGEDVHGLTQYGNGSLLPEEIWISQ